MWPVHALPNQDYVRILRILKLRLLFFWLSVSGEKKTKIIDIKVYIHRVINELNCYHNANCKKLSIDPLVPSY